MGTHKRVTQLRDPSTLPIQKEIGPSDSVFAKVDEDIYVYYDVELIFRDKLAGSVPSNPVNIAEMVRRQWAQATGQSKEEIHHDEFRRRVKMFLEETGHDVDTMADEDIDRIAGEKALTNLSIFRRDKEGLYFTSHAVKQALKENTNILFAGERWGKTKKGPMNYLAERLFVEPPKIRLLRDGTPITEADGTEVIHGRVQGPMGPRPVVTEHEFVLQPTLQFQLRVLEAADREHLADALPFMLRHLEENGLGSHRGFSEYGRVVVTKFERQSPTRKSRAKSA